MIIGEKSSIFLNFFNVKCGHYSAKFAISLGLILIYKKGRFPPDHIQPLSDPLGVLNCTFIIQYKVRSVKGVLKLFLEK